MIGQISRYITVTRRDRRWGLHVLGAGHAVTKPGQGYPPDPHPRGYDFSWERGRSLEEFALVYLVAGGGTFESTHQPPVTVLAGHAWFLFPGEWHRYGPSSATGWEEYWVIFGGAMAERWKQENLLRPRRAVISAGLGLSLAPTFEELLRLIHSRRPQASFAAAGLCHLLVGRTLGALQTLPGKASAERRILEAADYLRLHAEQAVDLPGLARHFAMSYSGFRRGFGKYIGMPPHRFHQQARIALVKEMLRESDAPLKMIADQLNYPSEFYLMQAFKRHTGLTPTQWRKFQTGGDRATPL